MAGDGGGATCGPAVAVILPCHNEEAAIADVVAAFRSALPEASIFVFDNGSTDDTSDVAEAAGARVRREPRLGKGNVVRRAFADIEADIFLIADGDGTYDAAAARGMIDLLQRECLDMVVGVRKSEEAGAYRQGHMLGNRLFSAAFRWLFRSDFTDIFSGYRVFSRRFVKSFPSTSEGFEIELEMSTHAALLRLPTMEVDTAYGPRIEGGVSKLNTYRDGLRILRRMLRFLRLHRPRLVYLALASAGAALSLALAAPVVMTYLQTGQVPRLPTAVLAASVMLAAIIMFVVGVILDAQARYFAETKRLAYLRAPAPPRPIASQADKARPAEAQGQGFGARA